MKKMLAATLCLTCFLCACGNTADSGAESVAVPEENTVTIEAVEEDVENTEDVYVEENTEEESEKYSGLGLEMARVDFFDIFAEELVAHDLDFEFATDSEPYSVSEDLTFYKIYIDEFVCLKTYETANGELLSAVISLESNDVSDELLADYVTTCDIFLDVFLENESDIAEMKTEMGYENIPYESSDTTVHSIGIIGMNFIKNKTGGTLSVSRGS